MYADAKKAGAVYALRSKTRQTTINCLRGWLLRCPITAVLSMDGIIENPLLVIGQTVLSAEQLGGWAILQVWCKTKVATC